MQVGIGAAGTLVPPKLTEFGLVTSALIIPFHIPLYSAIFTSDMNGQLDGTLQLDTTATVGRLKTSKFSSFDLHTEYLHHWLDPIVPGWDPRIGYPRVSGHRWSRIIQRLTMRSSILSGGPTFQISAKATAVVPIGVSLDADFEFNADNLELYFPPTTSSSSGDISNGKNSACTQIVVLKQPR